MQAAALLVPGDYETRTLEVARTLLQDIVPCRDADYRILWMGGAPHLVVAFHLPETVHQPACAVRLVTLSRSDPLKAGTHLEGDRLRRHIRTSIETYLHKNGVKLHGFIPGD